MKISELVKAMRKLKVQTGSLACLWMAGGSR